MFATLYRISRQQKLCVAIFPHKSITLLLFFHGEERRNHGQFAIQQGDFHTFLHFFVCAVCLTSTGDEIADFIGSGEAQLRPIYNFADI